MYTTWHTTMTDHAARLEHIALMARSHAATTRLTLEAI